MATTQFAPLAHPNTVPSRQAAISDRGPWLVLVLPVSFALTLLTVIYLAQASF